MAFSRADHFSADAFSARTHSRNCTNRLLCADSRPILGASRSIDDRDGVASTPDSSFQLLSFLEKILFPLTRESTNVVARILAERFGSVGRIVTASDAALAAALESHPTAAEAICSARKLIAVGYENQVTGEPVDSRDIRLQNYLQRELCNPDEERLFAIFLDPAGRFIAGECLARGGRSEVRFPYRAMVQRSLELGASAVLVAHNHTSGNSSPSQADRDVTHIAKTILGFMEIELLDHFVVTPHRIFSIRDGQLL